MGVLYARVGGVWVPISASNAAVAAEQAARIAADNALQAQFGSILATQTATGALQNVGTGGTLLTGLAVTFTAVAGARYVVLGQVTFRQRTTSGLVRLAILSSVPVATIGGARVSMGAEEYGFLIAMSKVQTPGAVSVTYSLQGYTSGGTVDYGGTGEGMDNLIQVFRV